MTSPIENIYLLDLVAYKDGTGVVTLHYGTSGYTLNGVYYEPRIKQPGNIKQSMFQNGKTGGASQVGYGEIILLNPDGGLDALVDYGFDGRAITLTEINQYGAATLLVGVQEQPTFSWDIIAIRIKDKQAALNVPIQPTKYLGNNSLPAGLEGVADIQGKPKPLAYGQCSNVTPYCVNTSRLIYQPSAELLYAIPAVYDSGVALTIGTLRTLADLQAAGSTKVFTVTSPTTTVVCTGHGYSSGDMVTVYAGTTLPAPLIKGTIYYVKDVPATGNSLTFYLTYADAIENTNPVNLTTNGSGTLSVEKNITVRGGFDWALDATGSYFRLGSPPVGQVTADVTQGATAAVRTTAQIARQIVLRKLATTDLVEQGFIDLDNANSSEVAIYIDSEMTINAALDIICPSVGAWYGFNNLGKFDMRRLEIPTGNAIMTLDVSNILSIERVAPSDAGRGVPAYKVTLDYDHNNTIQAQGLAGAVTAIRRNYLKDEYRTVESVDATILTKHPNAPELHFTSQLNTVANAQTESDRLLTLYKTRRDMLNVTCKQNALAYDGAGWWDDKSIIDMAISISGHSSVVFNNYLYVIGGYGAGDYRSSVIRLDLSNPTGSFDDAGVTDLPSKRSSHASVIHGNYVYVIGGDMTASKVIRLDLTSPAGAWENLHDLPANRISPSAVVFGNYIYVIGGTLTASVIRLDVSSPTVTTDTWDDAGVTDLPAARTGHSSVIFGNYVYVIGGSDGSNYLKSVIRLDLTSPSGAWNDAGVTDLPLERIYPTSAIMGNYVYVLGGLSNSGYQSSVTRLDLTNPSGIWDDVGVKPLPYVRSNSSAVSYSGNLYLIGGFTNGAVAQPNTYVYRTNENAADRALLTDSGRVINLSLENKNNPGTYRFGYNSSKLMRIIGTEKNFETGNITLTIWG